MKKEEIKALKKIPERYNHKCFGCSPVNENGLKMKFYTDEKSVYSNLTLADYFCGWENIVHGGIISTILDEIMSWSAIYLLKRFILTKSISVDFLKPVYVGEDLIVEGRVFKQNSEKEAVMEGFVINSSDELCAKSKGVFALFTFEAIQKSEKIDRSALLEFRAFFEDM